MGEFLRLSISLSACPYVYYCLSLSLIVSDCLRLSKCLCVYLSNLSNLILSCLILPYLILSYLSIHPFIHPSFFIYLCMYLFIYFSFLCLSLSLSLSVCLSIYQYPYHISTISIHFWISLAPKSNDCHSRTCIARAPATVSPHQTVRRGHRVGAAWAASENRFAVTRVTRGLNGDCLYWCILGMIIRGM